MENVTNEHCKDKEVIQAEVLGNTRVSTPVLEKLVHPDATPLHQIPQANEVETALSKIENLIGKGHYGAALRKAKALKIDDSSFAPHYEFFQQEKISRANIGVADRYFIRGDKDSARTFYERALQFETSNTTITGIAGLASHAFDQLLARRQGLFDDLKNSIKADSYAEWCGKKNEIQTATLVEVSAIRTAIFPDFSLEGIFGDRPPIQPTPGWIDPLPPETEFIDFTSVTPGSVFKADTEKAVTVDLRVPGFEGTRLDENRIRASVALPIIANVLTAKARLFAMAQGLNLAGQAQGVVPLFRYEYLRAKAKEIISHIQDIELRMLPIQFRLDDFTEVVSTIRRHLAEQLAELAATNQRINELVQTLTALAQVEKELTKAVQLLEQARDECDCDWFCWLTTVLAIGVFAVVAAAVAAAGAASASIGGGLIIAAILSGAGIGALTTFLIIDFVDCRGVGEITTSVRNVLTGLRQAIQENEAELNHQLAIRDIVIANLNALFHELSEVNASNQARVLNATVLSAIQAQYNSIRQSLLTRGQAI